MTATIKNRTGATILHVLRRTILLEYFFIVTHYLVPAATVVNTLTLLCVKFFLLSRFLPSREVVGG